MCTASLPCFVEQVCRDVSRKGQGQRVRRGWFQHCCVTCLCVRDWRCLPPGWPHQGPTPVPRYQPLSAKGWGRPAPLGSQDLLALLYIHVHLGCTDDGNLSSGVFNRFGSHTLPPLPPPHPTTSVSVSLSLSLSPCVCVREREREQSYS